MLMYKIKISFRQGHTKVLANSSPCWSSRSGSWLRVNGSWLEPLPYQFTTKLWKQKRRGSKFLPCLSHLITLSHCPFVRISNVKPAHASDDIYTLRRRIPKETITITLTITIHIRKDSTPIERSTPYYIYKGNVGRREI